MIFDFERAEPAVFRRAFEFSDDQGKGLVPRSHLLLRFYIVEHTALSEESLDFELARVCSDSENIGLESFSAIMLRGCLKDNESAVRWARASCSHQTISIVECRQALELYAQESFRSEVPEADLGDVLDVVLNGAGLTVAFDEWDVLLEKVARRLRLLRQIECV